MFGNELTDVLQSCIRCNALSKMSSVSFRTRYVNQLHTSGEKIKKKGELKIEEFEVWCYKLCFLSSEQVIFGAKC